MQITSLADSQNYKPQNQTFTGIKQVKSKNYLISLTAKVIKYIENQRDYETFSFEIL